MDDGKEQLIPMKPFIWTLLQTQKFGGANISFVVTIAFTIKDLIWTVTHLCAGSDSLQGHCNDGSVRSNALSISIMSLHQHPLEFMAWPLLIEITLRI